MGKKEDIVDFGEEADAFDADILNAPVEEPPSPNDSMSQDSESISDDTPMPFGKSEEENRALDSGYEMHTLRSSDYSKLYKEGPSHRGGRKKRWKSVLIWGMTAAVFLYLFYLFIGFLANVPPPARREAPSQKEGVEIEKKGVEIVKNTKPPPDPFDWEAVLNRITQTLLLDYKVVAVLHPKDIDKRGVESDVVRIVKQIKDNGKDVGFYERTLLRKDALSREVTPVFQGMIESRIGDVEELRGVTGGSALTDAEKKVLSERILTELMDAIILGREGLIRFEPGEEAMRDRIDRDRKQFESTIDFGEWKDERYGGDKHYENWVRLELAGENYLRDARRREIRVPAEEIRAYYDANKPDLEEPERMVLDQIFVKISSLDRAEDRKKKRDDIDDLLTRLNRGESFDDLAARYSEYGDREERRILVERNELPKEMGDIVFNLRPGRVSPVIASQRGFHLFKIMKHSPPGVRPYAEVEQEIRARLADEKLARYLDNRIPELRAKMEIKRKNDSR